MAFTYSADSVLLTCWQVSSKYASWFCERIIWQSMCGGSWTGVTYLRCTVLTSPKKEETAVHCWSCFISSCHVGVSKRLPRSIRLAVYFLADQISCRSCVGSVYRKQSLVVSDFSLLICARSQICTSIPMWTKRSHKPLIFANFFAPGIVANADKLAKFF